MTRPGPIRFQASRWTRFLVVTLCVWSRVPAPAAENPTGGNMRTVLRDTFTYDPTVRPKAEAEAAKKIAGGAVQMDAVVITDDKTNPAFNGYMARQRQLKAAKKPSLARGAEIPGLTGVGVTPYVDRIPFGQPTPRWSLINLPW